MQDFNSAKNSLEKHSGLCQSKIRKKLDLENDVLQIYASDNPMGKEIILLLNTTTVQQ